MGLTMKNNDNVLFGLMSKGFVIYPEKEKWIVSKRSVPGHQITFEDVECDNYEEAVKTAIQSLEKRYDKEYFAIVRYNRGLGIEYRNLPSIFANSYEKAVEVSNKLISEIFTDPSYVIIETRVRLKN